MIEHERKPTDDRKDGYPAGVSRRGARPAAAPGKPTDHAPLPVELEADRNATAILVSAGAMIGGTLGVVASAWSRVVCIQFVLHNPPMANEVIVLRRRDAARLNLTQ